MSEWISVKDRLPNKTDTYLAYCGEYDGINLLSYVVGKIKGNKQLKISYKKL